jgi:calcineurin-like phosphoesterase
VGGTAVASRIQEYLSGIPDWTKEAWDRLELEGVLLDLGENGKALSIERIRFPVTPPAPSGESGDD